jgi:hypothetical protein
MQLLDQLNLLQNALIKKLKINQHVNVPHGFHSISI